MGKVIWTFSRFDQLTNEALYELLRLRNEVFVLEQNCPYQDADRKDYLAIHLQGYLENELVAYCRILDKGISYADYPSIGRVVTSMSVRRTGLGRELMEEAMKYSLAHYGNKIKLSGQAYLRNFYESLGFRVVSETTYLEDNIPHYAMLYEKVDL